MSGRHSTEGFLRDRPVLSLQSLLGAVLSSHYHSYGCEEHRCSETTKNFHSFPSTICQLLGSDYSEALITLLQAPLTLFTLLQFQFHILSPVGQNFL